MDGPEFFFSGSQAACRLAGAGLGTFKGFIQEGDSDGTAAAAVSVVGYWAEALQARPAGRRAAGVQVVEDPAVEPVLDNRGTHTQLALI